MKGLLPSRLKLSLIRVCKYEFVTYAMMIKFYSIGEGFHICSRLLLVIEMALSSIVSSVKMGKFVANPFNTKLNFRECLFL